MIEITKLKPRVTEEGTTGMFSSPSDLVDIGMICRKEKQGKKLYVIDEDELATLTGENTQPIPDKSALSRAAALVTEAAAIFTEMIAPEKKEDEKTDPLL